MLFLSQSALLGWLLFIQAWVLVLWFARSGARNSFGRRLDQFLGLLLPQADEAGHGPVPASWRITSRTLGGPGTLGGLRRSARRWRAPLRAFYTQGYQVAAETISSPPDSADASRFLRETIEILRPGRNGGSGAMPNEDPVVILAYGVGAWPASVNLSGLEQLLEELGVSHGELRSRFEGLVRTIAAAQNREFRELAGAAFVLGASARIVEAADPSAKSAPPPGWHATFKMHGR